MTHQKNFSADFNVRSYEVQTNGSATLGSVCNYFQEAAGLHAHELEFDISQLQAKGITWILYKMNIEILDYPERWNTVKVLTWPSSGDGLRAYRDYQLFNSEGQIIAKAVSQWMVLDLKTRRPVRMPREIVEMGLEQEQHVMEFDKSQLKVNQGTDSVEITTVGKHDLDMNDHVNNVKYIDWLTGYPPPLVSKEKQCFRMEIQYISEATLGDRIHLSQETRTENGGYILDQQLSKNGSMKEIAKAQSVWR
ncbi:MAG: acyl-ACP thioesterase domain-containing protein [Balneolaceae bacterium]